MVNIQIRNVKEKDYPIIIGQINDWWGGREMSDMLPKLFFVHFHETSFVAEIHGGIVGFIVGFDSQSFAEESYIHFAGVHPDYRKKGVARALYERFFQVAQARGRSKIRCVTSPVNTGSIRFHKSLGFTIESGQKVLNGIPVAENYDGKGGDRVLFSKILHA